MHLSPEFLGYVVGIIGFYMVGAQFAAAYRDSFLTVTQMKAKGFSKGLPLLYHAGIWGDLIITPVLVYIVAKHANQWYIGAVALAHFIGLAAIICLGSLWVYGAKHGLPEAHTYGGQMTVAGWVHAIYFVEAIAVIVLFYFFSKITPTETYIISAILGIHVVYGTHIFLGLAAPEWFTNRPQKDPATWGIIAAVWAALIWRCLTI